MGHVHARSSHYANFTGTLRLFAPLNCDDPALIQKNVTAIKH